MFTTRKLAAVLGTAVLCFGLSGQAQAVESYSCSYIAGSSTYFIENNSGGAADNASVYDNDRCSYGANATSAVATSSAILAAASSQAANLVSNRISNALTGSGGMHMAANGFNASTGMSGGNMGNKLGAWVSGSWSDVSDDNTATKFDGNVYNAMVGVDYRVAPKVVIGLAAGYEDSDIDTVYNESVVTGADGNISADGYTVAPYIGVQLNDHASADLTIGYSNLDYDTTRYDPLNGDRLTGSTDADRYFINANVNGNHVFANHWNLNGRLGVFYASEDKDSYVEHTSGDTTFNSAVSQNGGTTELGQFSADARLGYLFDMIEPYALAGLDFDFTKDEGTLGGLVGFDGTRSTASHSSFDSEDFGARFGGGLNLRLGSNVTGGIEAYTVEFRDDYEEVTATAGLRVNF